MQTILFIHGFATGPEIWELQVREFSKDYKVSTSAEDIKYTQDVIVVGWSMGAFEAVRLYFEHKNKIKALVLVSATPRFLKSEDYPYGLSPALLRNLEKKLKGNFESGLQYFYNLMFYEKELHPIIKEMPVPDKEDAFRQLERLRIEDMRGSLSQVKVPVFLMHGDKDQICLPEASEYMHRRISRSELKTFQGLGHAPFLENAEEFNLSLRSFINKHEDR